MATPSPGLQCKQIVLGNVICPISLRRDSHVPQKIQGSLGIASLLHDNGWWQITRCSTVKTIYHWWMVWNGVIPYIHRTFVPTWETYQDSNFDDVEVHHALRGMIGGLGLLASRIICYFSKCNAFIIIKPGQMNLLGQLFRKGPTFWGPKTRVLRMFQPCSRITFMGLMNPHLLGGFLVGALLRRLLRRFSQAPPLWARAARNLSRSNRAWKSYESYDPAIQLGYVGPVRNCPGLCWNMFFQRGKDFRWKLMSILDFPLFVSHWQLDCICRLKLMPAKTVDSAGFASK